MLHCYWASIDKSSEKTILLGCWSFPVEDNTNASKDNISSQKKQPHGTRSSNMASFAGASSQQTSLSIITSILSFLMLAFFLTPAVSDSGHRLLANQTFRPQQELLRIKRVRAYLRKNNKPAVKSIQAFSFAFCSFRFFNLMLLHP